MNLPSFLKGFLGPSGRDRPAPMLPPASADTLEQKVGPGAVENVRKRAQLPEPRADQAPIAPFPAIDRYPTVLGSNVSLAYISSVFRLATTGYRREYCDLLDELLERDPHMYAVVAQRVHAVVGGELTFVAADCDEKDEERAEEIRTYVAKAYDRIPERQQVLAQLQWGGVYYGVGALETAWRMAPDDKVGLGWVPARLHWIHSRRLAYPDPNGWGVRVWDQGMVSSWDMQNDPTGMLFGVGCDDFPGKFIVHAPSVRGNYPTRDGLGREMAYWSALKLMGARGAAQYIERFGKPWVIGTYKTGEKEAEHRPAGEEDIKAVEAASLALGIGSLSSATLPDSVEVEIKGPAANAPGRQLLHVQFINCCNAEISKAALGQTDTVEASPNGSRGAVEVRKQGTQELYRYDAACLADTLEHGLVKWIVALNFPGEEHLCPRVSIQAVEEPDLTAIVERAAKLAYAGAPVDVDALGEQVGIAMVPMRQEGDDPKKAPRRLYQQAPIKPYELQDLLKLDRGEELEPPPKLIDPSAEAPSGRGSGGGAQGAPGSTAKPPGGKAALPGPKVPQNAP